MFWHTSPKSWEMSTTEVPARKPLQGIKVLELGTLIAGPFCSRMLAEFGAEVIKVEDPKLGDPLRRWRLMHGDTSLWWSVQSRNKKSLTLNLKDARAQQIALRLALDADIVIENYRPGVLEKWGLGYATLSASRLSSIMVRLSGYGQTGPKKDQPGFGAIAESMGGLRHVSGHTDRPPVRIGISIGDSLAALHGVIGALMALHHRDATGGRQSGQGQLVDVALYEAVFNMMESMVPEFDRFGFIRSRTGGALPGIVPSNTYPCANGESVVIAGNGDAIYLRLMRAIGRADLADDVTLAHNDGRVLRVIEIDQAISTFTGVRSVDEVIAVLSAADVPCGKIFSVEDMVHDAQFIARDMFEDHQLDDGTPVKFPGIVPKLSKTPGKTEWLGPRLGQHTDEILASLGYDVEQCAKLHADGVV
jgi:crotonobetainyl-CoA:carnitine CoA-transferase CaiB-like acyl-CoA transferase